MPAAERGSAAARPYDLDVCSTTLPAPTRRRRVPGVPPLRTLCEAPPDANPAAAIVRTGELKLERLLWGEHEPSLNEWQSCRGPVWRRGHEEAVGVTGGGHHALAEVDAPGEPSGQEGATATGQERGSDCYRQQARPSVPASTRALLALHANVAPPGDEETRADAGPHDQRLGLLHGSRIVAARCRHALIGLHGWRTEQGSCQHVSPENPCARARLRSPAAVCRPRVRSSIRRVSQLNSGKG